MSSPVNTAARFFWAGVLAILMFAQPAHAQSFVGRYGPVRSPQLVQMHESLRNSRFAEGLAAGLSLGITLPQQVVVAVGECGQSNAFYTSAKKALIICDELFLQVIQGIQRDYARKATPEEIKSISTGALMFIVMHEIGHALIDLLQLPVLGREEDAADQIGVFFLLHMNKAPEALAGAVWFFRPNTFFYTRRHFGDEHSVGPQRQANLMCWAVGKDPGRYQYLLRSGVLTRERAPKCADEYAKLDSSMRRLLGDNVKLPPS